MSLKRAIDVTAAIGVLALLLPVLALVAVGILLTMGGPLFFLQSRSGRNGSLFTLLKFRTMTEVCDAQGRLLPDALRLTQFGRFVRESSLDELPQLWNVLMGEMSLVGPRPLPPQYLDRYSEFQRRRLEVTPGITGWAQIHGRNTLAWEPRFACDVWYVDNWSLMLDFRILARTVACVLKREGIGAQEHDTMAEFQGSPDASALSVTLKGENDADIN